MTTRQAEKLTNIWIVTREYGELAGAGGVKDMTVQLAAALAAKKMEVSVVLPLYGFMNPKQLGFTPLEISYEVDLSYVREERREQVSIWHQRDQVDIYLIDSLRFREKMGVYTYTAQEAKGHPFRKPGDGHYDYFAMNVLLQKAAIELAIVLEQKPDIFHCHDGHTALLPAMIREKEGFRDYFQKTGCVVTIHNAGLGYHQEVADLEFAQAITGLPRRLIADSLLLDCFDPLLAASAYAVLNTVSENYARELRETEADAMTGWLGHELLQRGICLEGVTNGIDPTSFDPRQPAALGLAAGFTPGSPASGLSPGKTACKKQLYEALQGRHLKGLAQTGTLSWQPDQPLFTFIGRFSSQKGVDKMIEALKKLLPIDPDFQILILGSGQKEIEESLLRLAGQKAYQGRICLLRGYDPIAANRIYAAGDFFIIPSQYEPCGLTDYLAQIFGNIPIVHHIGGLVKVVDGETGFAYHEHSGEALATAMSRALTTFRGSRRTIAAMQKAAIRLLNEKYTWRQVVEAYLALYGRAQAHNQAN